ncbi:MAG: hypothetical protein AABY32_04420 [Nanoarchaeota archaeon]
MEISIQLSRDELSSTNKDMKFCDVSYLDLKYSIYKPLMDLKKYSKKMEIVFVDGAKKKDIEIKESGTED